MGERERGGERERERGGVGTVLHLSVYTYIWNGILRSIVIRLGNNYSDTYYYQRIKSFHIALSCNLNITYY